VRAVGNRDETLGVVRSRMQKNLLKVEGSKQGGSEANLGGRVTDCEERRGVKWGQRGAENFRQSTGSYCGGQEREKEGGDSA